MFYKNLFQFVFLLFLYPIGSVLIIVCIVMNLSRISFFPQLSEVKLTPYDPRLSSRQNQNTLQFMETFLWSVWPHRLWTHPSPLIGFIMMNWWRIRTSSSHPNYNEFVRIYWRRHQHSSWIKCGMRRKGNIHVMQSIFMVLLNLHTLTSLLSVCPISLKKWNFAGI